MQFIVTAETLHSPPPVLFTKRLNHFRNPECEYYVTETRADDVIGSWVEFVVRKFFVCGECEIKVVCVHGEELASGEIKLIAYLDFLSAAFWSCVLNFWCVSGIDVGCETHMGRCIGELELESVHEDRSNDVNWRNIVNVTAYNYFQVHTYGEVKSRIRSWHW